jgi:hypothetical protein
VNADRALVDRRVIWLFVLVGTTVGGFLPEAWGAGSFGGASLIFSLLGGLGGLWLGVRLAS